jgi:hypothetical protein
MSRKSLIMIGMVVGSAIGGYVPALWGSGLLSYSSLFGNAIGGIIGIFIAYKLTV